jgi:hypothetical protein
MKTPSTQILLPTAIAAGVGGAVAVGLSGRSWLWVGIAVGAGAGWVISKWKHFYLNRRIGPVRGMKEVLQARGKTGLRTGHKSDSGV